MLLTDETGAVDEAAPATDEQFERSATAFLAPAAAELTSALARTGLAAAERAALRTGAMAALHDTVLRKISRVLVLELNAARITGSLTAADSAGRWAEFVDRTCTPGYWASLTRYPPLLSRLHTVVANRVAAAVELAARFARDRELLDVGELTSAEFGAGDSHRGGRTVVLLRGTSKSTVYKPRSVAVDRALANLLAAVVPDADHPIRVPSVHIRPGYGWAEHVTHRYCATDAELQAFYRNLGRWLAIMRLVGGTDLYSGIAGVAVLLAAYVREQAAGRADEVPGLPELLAAAIRTLRLSEDRWRTDVAAGVPLRPEPPGGYVGLGSRITGWLLLHRLGAVGGEAVERARWLAGQAPRAVADDPAFDVLIGRAGVVVPLLRLAEHAGDGDLVKYASTIGDQLVAASEPRGETVCWPNKDFPEGIGGFAHGATGIGWALARLAMVTGDETHAGTARAAFAYEETLYSTSRAGWRDLREPDQIGGAWCHGAGGIGLAALDLVSFDDSMSEVAERAAKSAWQYGLGWNHTLCHGDLGLWELATATPGFDSSTVDAHMVAVLEEYGIVTGLAREAFSPALLPGAGGVAYQLLRLHPEADLPSVLLPDPGPPS